MRIRDLAELRPGIMPQIDRMIAAAGRYKDYSAQIEQTRSDIDKGLIEKIEPAERRNKFIAREVEIAASKGRLPDTPTGRTQVAGEPGSVGTSGVGAPEAAVPVDSAAPESRPAGAGRVVVLPRPRPLITIARPSGVNGAFVEFNEARWYSSGPAVELDSGHMRIGQYRGLPVYSRSGGGRSMIFIPVTADAPTLLTPYTRR